MSYIDLLKNLLQDMGGEIRPFWGPDAKNLSEEDRAKVLYDTLMTADAEEIFREELSKEIDDGINSGPSRCFDIEEFLTMVHEKRKS